MEAYMKLVAMEVYMKLVARCGKAERTPYPS
jgi:hypothetical protein